MVVFLIYLIYMRTNRNEVINFFELENSKLYWPTISASL